MFIHFKKLLMLSKPHWRKRYKTNITYMNNLVNLKKKNVTTETLANNPESSNFKEIISLSKNSFVGTPVSVIIHEGGKIMIEFEIDYVRLKASLMKSNYLTYLFGFYFNRTKN